MMGSNLRIATFKEAGAFLEHAQEALEQNEEENHLILGICQRMRALPDSEQGQSFLAVIDDRGEFVLAAMMNPPFPLVLGQFGRPYQEALAVLAEELNQKGWLVKEVNGPDQVSELFADTWSGLIGGVPRFGRRQRLYTLEKVEFPSGVSGNLRRASPTDLPVVLEWGKGFTTELSGVGEFARFERTLRSHVANSHVYLWEVNEPVSMAMDNRPSRNGVAISYVYTPPEKRRHGYASACVAALSQEMLASGYKFCALYTDSDNQTTNRIYQQIGYKPVTDFTTYTFSNTVNR